MACAAAAVRAVRCEWCDAGARRCDECIVVAVVVVLVTHTQNCTIGRRGDTAVQFAARCCCGVSYRKRGFTYSITLSAAAAASVVMDSDEVLVRVLAVVVVVAGGVEVRVLEVRSAAAVVVTGVV